MGLVASVNRVEMAILSDKQEKMALQEEKKKQQQINVRDKIDKANAEHFAKMALQEAFQIYFDKYSFEECEKYLHSKSGFDKITATIGGQYGEFAYNVAKSQYFTKLGKVKKPYQFGYKQELKRQEEKKKPPTISDLPMWAVVVKAICDILAMIVKLIAFGILAMIGAIAFCCKILPKPSKSRR